MSNQFSKYMINISIPDDERGKEGKPIIDSNNGSVVSVVVECALNQPSVKGDLYVEESIQRDWMVWNSANNLDLYREICKAISKVMCYEGDVLGYLCRECGQRPVSGPGEICDKCYTKCKALNDM